MSRLKMVLASYLTPILLATFFVSQSAFSQEKPLKELTVSEKETVASFVQHMFPAAEYLTGATLMTLQSIPVVGAFAHDAGVYLLLGAAFEEGADLAKIISDKTGTSASIGHAGSAAVLYLAGSWTYRDGAPVSAADWNSIFVRAAATNEYSNAAKAVIAENSNKVSVKTAWNPALQLSLATIAAVITSGPMRSINLASGSNGYAPWNQRFAAGMHRSAIITATYRAADLAGIAVQTVMGTSEPATTFFKSVALTTTGWGLIQYIGQPRAGYSPANYMLNVVGENLVEAAFLGAAASMVPAVENTVKHYVPIFPEASGFAAVTAITAGFWKYAQHHQMNRVVKQAESGWRLGYILFSFAPRIHQGIQYTATEVARHYGDNIAAGYSKVKGFLAELTTGKDKKEL